MTAVVAHLIFSKDVEWIVDTLYESQNLRSQNLRSQNLRSQKFT